MTIKHTLEDENCDILTVEECLWVEPDEPHLCLTHPLGGYEAPFGHPLDGQLLDAPDVSIDLSVEQARFLHRVTGSWLREIDE